MKWNILVLFFLGLLLNLSGAELVRNGISNSVIIIAPKASKSAQLAAMELQYHISKITGVSLPIVKTCPPVGKVRIFVSPEKLTVCDDGCGIPPHELPRIFDRGFVGEAGRKRGNGTGMGLYLVKRTCGNIGIEVTARSEQGKYTRFIFSFAR